MQHSSRIRPAARWAVVLGAAFAAVALAAPVAGADSSGSNCVSTAPASPYPGWVQVVDDTGVPYLYPAGSAPASPAVCVRSIADQPTATSPASSAGTQSAPQRLESPYPGWVFVYDDQGVPWLEQVSDYR